MLLRYVNGGASEVRAKVDVIVDARGKQKAVVLSFREYSRLLTRLEDLQDALELKQAQAEGGEFEDLNAVLSRLKTPNPS